MNIADRIAFLHNAGPRELMSDRQVAAFDAAYHELMSDFCRTSGMTHEEAKLVCIDSPHPHFRALEKTLKETQHITAW